MENKKRNKATANRSQQFIDELHYNYRKFSGQKMIKKSQVMSLKSTLKNLVKCLSAESSPLLSEYNRIKNRITVLCNKKQKEFTIDEVGVALDMSC